MIADNVKKILTSLPADVKLVAASKYANSQQINEAIQAGVTAIGENRVQDAARKFPELHRVEKHMIGHLQTNKVKQAVEIFDCIQTVDSLKLATEINKRSKKIMHVMIQVNISNEEQKYGINPGDVNNFYEKICQLDNIKIVGLMGMAPHIDAEMTRPYFKQLSCIFTELKLQYLSMGMSNDFEVAIEEGANVVRIGSQIFLQ